MHLLLPSNCTVCSVDKWKISIRCEGRRLSISFELPFPLTYAEATLEFSASQPATI